MTIRVISNECERSFSTFIFQGVVHEVTLATKENEGKIPRVGLE